MRVLPGLLIPLIFPAAALLPTPEIATIKQPPSLRVTVATGAGEAVGSGTHIGGGYVITASHVVEGEGIISLYSEDRTPYRATRVSDHPLYDFAIIKADLAENVAAADVDCSPTHLGEEMQFTGQPNRQYFLTFWGRVGSRPSKTYRWQSAVWVDGFAMTGMSGAGGLSAGGRLRSVFVGAYEVPTGFQDHSIPVPLGMAVPSSVFCPMLKEAGVM